MSTPTTAKQGNLLFLRVAITLRTLCVFVQASTAGLLPSAPTGETPHGAGRG
jgi:hypothetical protein